MDLIEACGQAHRPIAFDAWDIAHRVMVADGGRWVYFYNAREQWMDALIDTLSPHDCIYWDTMVNRWESWRDICNSLDSQN